MSTIEKMSIQGIRSFGHGDSDKQLLHFFSPLTLILGQNGTGKTTIIECLKYLTTGDLPSGSKTGAAFIHDPKVANLREVKGQIKLQFLDISGQQCVVQRSMVATQKPKKVEMRTLDGIIARRGPDGEKKSITQKCAEIDREMVTALGVSKPVLENVIFCHQDDSNWPLSEGKALKDKFDAIFASTRYVKALDCIRKIKQEQDANVKLYRRDIKYLKEYKQKACELKENLEADQAKHKELEKSIGTIKAKLQPVEEKLDNLLSIQAKLNKLTNDIEKLSGEKKQLEKAIEELQKNIKNEFQGSTNKLQSTLNEFQSKLAEMEDLQMELEFKQERLISKADHLQKTESELLLDLGKLEQEAEVNKENIQKRDSLIRKLAGEYQFEGFCRGPFTDGTYKQFLNKLNKQYEIFMKNAQEAKLEFEDLEQNLQQEIDDVRDRKTKIEQKIDMKQERIRKNDDKIKVINQKLDEANTSECKVNELTGELEKVKEDLQTTVSSVDIDRLKKEIGKLNREKTVIEGRLTELGTELNQLHRQSTFQTQLDMLRKDKNLKDEHIRKRKDKHEGTIIRVLGEMPASHLRGELDKYVINQAERICRLRKELLTMTKEHSKQETQRKMVMEDQQRKETEMRRLAEKIYDVCGSQNFDEEMQNIKQKLLQSQDQKGSLLGAEHFFKKYVDDLKKNNPCCPLCHRLFEQNQEVQELVIELENKLQLVPSKLNQTESNLNKYQTKYDRVVQLRPLKEKLKSLEEEIPQFKGKLDKINEAVTRIKNNIQKKEDELQRCESDEAVVKDMLPDVLMMDNYLGEVQELDKKIAIQLTLLSCGGSERTVEEVISQQSDVQLELDTLNKQLEHKHQKHNDYLDHVCKLRSEVNRLQQEKIQTENDLQQCLMLKDNVVKLKSEVNDYSCEIQEDQKKIKPLEIKLEKLKKEKNNITLQKEKTYEEKKLKADNTKLKGINKLENINSDIQSYVQLSKEATLVEKKRQQAMNQMNLEAINTERNDVVNNIDKIRRDFAMQKVRKRELEDNLLLRGKEKELVKLNKWITELELELDDYNVQNLKQEQDQLMAIQQKLRQDHLTESEMQLKCEISVTAAKKELQTDMYRDAEVKYRDQMISLRTTELAITDLEKYYKALDKAIMNYHSLKMDEINKIIRDLWRNIYKGNDIGTIEIRSSEDEGGIMKNRRNYIYRVVMIKDKTVLDMRGRCSAGQKVLAALIIRLALAETFSLNCGILALDEPTTNLDRENIESLASALIEFIKARSYQRNFQLIVITHDEDFVELLGRSDYVNDFYKVRKNEVGCSQIIRAKVQNLHMR